MFSCILSYLAVFLSILSPFTHPHVSLTRQAGKSTLLHAIAGRIPDSKKVRLEGVRYLNGQAVDGDATLPAALVEQDVNFFPHMTVRETLDFRVELQMGRTLSPAARRTMVEDLMAQMHLTKAADTIVGDAKVRGISGGERKRLSVAVELISSPSIIFLDEVGFAEDVSVPRQTTLVCCIPNLILLHLYSSLSSVRPLFATTAHEWPR
jgi:ABC-type sulfate/molybdate transport systems ATPase subunit